MLAFFSKFLENLTGRQRLFALVIISILITKQKKYHLALPYIKEAIKIAKENNDNELVYSLEGYQYLTEVPYNNKIKIGRNDPCPCNSGKKYKKCCGKNS